MEEGLPLVVLLIIVAFDAIGAILALPNFGGLLRPAGVMELSSSSGAISDAFIDLVDV